MLLSWLTKFTASLLVSIIFSAVLILLLDQTILNSHYLEGQLASTNSYVKLSGALSDQIIKSSDGADPALKPKLQAILTPSVLQTKLSGALEQLQAYYKGNGPVPVIDLTDLVNQAQAAGIKIGDGSGLTKPITIKSNSKVKGIATAFRSVKLGTIVGVVVLTALLLLLSWERHKYAALPDVIIIVGILFAIIALLFNLAPGFADHTVKFNFGSNGFATIGHNLALSIVHDLAKRFDIIAAGYLAVGISVRIWLARRHHHLATAPAPRTKLAK